MKKVDLPTRVTVIGCGVSGIAAAAYLVSQGVSVFLSDGSSSSVVAQKVAAADLTEKLTFEGGGNSEKVYNTDLVVLSPGVPIDSPLVVELQKRDIPFIGEMELGFQASFAPFVAVTGSTGKSTTVSIIDCILSHAERERALCGNIGTPVIEAAPKLSNDGIAICEVSSFQLETIKTFQPAVAVILNLAPNHLDRHASLKEYYQTKFRIVENMVDGLIILNGLQKELVDFGKQISQNRVLFFGTGVAGFDSVIEEEGEIFFLDREGKRCSYGSMENLPLVGYHNRQNALVAAAIASHYDIPATVFEQGLSFCKGLPHRMEFVAEQAGVRFFNDSKATTAESVEAALRGFEDHSVHLIAGGKDKGADFGSLQGLVKQKCCVVYAIGEAAETVKTAWGDEITQLYSTLKLAIESASEQSCSGETILLSPGCASFDMFDNFVDRGNQFKTIVRELIL